VVHSEPLQLACQENDVGINNLRGGICCGFSFPLYSLLVEILRGFVLLNCKSGYSGALNETKNLNYCITEPTIVSECFIISDVICGTEVFNTLAKFSTSPYEEVFYIQTEIRIAHLLRIRINYLRIHLGRGEFF